MSIGVKLTEIKREIPQYFGLKEALPVIHLEYINSYQE